jgi:hypothetical protein
MREDEVEPGRRMTTACRTGSLVRTPVEEHGGTLATKSPP